MRLKRPSPAMLVALLALFIALGGTSYSAITLSRNSVGSKQIVNGGVKRKDIGRNAVTSVKVKDRSLRRRDFKPGPLPQGPKGDKGDQGVPGEPGSARAYALIGSNGSVNRAKNITGVSHEANSAYCFDLPFTPDNAIATGARPGPGNFSLKTLVTVAVGPGDLGANSCVAPFTDAVALVAEEGQGSAVDRAFFIMFN